MGSRISIQGDVYSFGILLLEMLTGRRPTEEMFKDGLSLHKYVLIYFPERLVEIIDPRPLFEEKDGGKADQSVKNRRNASMQMHDFLVPLIRLGISCSKELPRERMSMNDVLRELNAIRDAYVER